MAYESYAREAREPHTPVGRVKREKKNCLSPVSLSVFSLVPDLLFDCSRLLEYAKIRTVLQSTICTSPIIYLVCLPKFDITFVFTKFLLSITVFRREIAYAKFWEATSTTITTSFICITIQVHTALQIF